MNIKAQCCGIALLVVIMYFYAHRRKLNLSTERAYKRLFIVTFLNLFLDVISIIALTYQMYLSDTFVRIICKSYISLIVLTAFMGVMYIITDIYKGNKQYLKIIYVMTALVIIGVALVFALPIYSYCDKDQNVFTYGPSVFATYIITLGIILFTVFLLFIKKKDMDIRRWEAMRVWMFLWVGSAVVQFLFNEVLLVGFSGAIGIIIIYLKLENPEINYDKETGFFSQTAFIQYVSQLHKEKKLFTVFEIVFPYSIGTNVTEYGGEEVDKEIIKYFMELEEVNVFVKDEDELVLVFTDDQDSEVVINQIKNRFEFGWGKDGSIYISPEYIYMPDGNMIHSGEDIRQLLRYARANSKRNMDGNTILVDNNILKSMYEEKRVQSLILDAIENDRVEVFYQPIYSTAEKKFTSAEALIRIVSEDGVIISPGVFVEVAEKNGMIMQLGEIVFDKVCKFLSTVNPEKYGVQYIEVNLSVVQCNYEHLAESMIRIMDKYEINPAWINMEITESASIDKKEVMINNMLDLIDYGVRFSLDDFGTGQSNLNYIVEMPVDIVKFDRNMILSYFDNGKAKYVMDAAMHMIHGLRLAIVAEGIENKEQLDTMIKLGINHIQGYYFSKPMPQDDFVNFICEKNV